MPLACFLLCGDHTEPLWTLTSALACLPKYISEEMALTLPNFFWASSVFSAGSESGLRRVVGLQLETAKAGMTSARWWSRSFSHYPPENTGVCVCVCVIWLIFVFIYLAAPGLSCSVQDLVPQPGIEPTPSAMKVQNPNHWITREFLRILVLTITHR